MNIMRPIVTASAMLLLWSAGKLRTPLAVFTGLLGAFGQNLYQPPWQNPGPWRATAGLLIGWAVYELCTLLRDAFQAAWARFKDNQETLEIFEPPF